MVLALVLLAVGPGTSASAEASFGFRPGTEGFEASLLEADSSPDHSAGTHPYAAEIDFGFNQSGGLSDGDLRDLDLTLPPGLLTNPGALPECTPAKFSTPRVSPNEASLSGESCPDGTQIGVVSVDSSYAGGATRTFGLYNLAPTYGSPAAIGFAPFGEHVALTASIREADSALRFSIRDLTQTLAVTGLRFTIWGTPGDHAHDFERGNCLNEVEPSAPWGKCATSEARAYLTLPSSCGEQLQWSATATSWQGASGTASLAGDPGGLDGCVAPLSRAKFQLRTDSAATPTGLLFNIDINDGGGFLNPPGIVRSPISSARAVLPEGLTINPSLAAGLDVCTPVQFALESASTPPGSGCPNASKIGNVAIEGLFGLPESVSGSVFLAEPYENPSGSLLALYVTVASPRRGLFTKALGRLDPDPGSGQLTATFEDLPQLHYTHLTIALREGQRSALISPPACGNYTTDLDLVPWNDPANHFADSSTLPISHGEGGGPCPTGAARPFAPALVGGSLNLSAGSYSPFDIRISRTDAEQEISSYSATFPPGLLGRIAGIPYCPEGAIEAAKGRSATEEIANPSCPAASQIGHTLTGYGAGSVLAYAAGGLYLAGPFHGAPLSTVAINPAQVGPFDLGTIVIRSAIHIDPTSAQVSIDSTGSDPIPHIRKGIPLHLRDIRAHLDRPQFIVNPTNCDPLSLSSSVTGAGSSLSSAADDVLATTANRFQLGNCTALGFSPRFSLALKGSPRHGAYPSLRATLVPRPGDANLEAATVTLPPSLFFASEHIGTICTRPDFAAHRCPAASVYGKAKAITPLLEEPLEGPVYLRASDHKVPDLVAALSGRGIEIDAVGRLDRHHSGIRGRFEALPDAPLTRFEMSLPGGKKGLLVNSVDLCQTKRRASTTFTAHNSLTVTSQLKIAVRCKRRHVKKGSDKRRVSR